MKKIPNVEIYTDGACSGNPGKGGYGVVIRYKKSNGEYISKEISEGFKVTTNNRMEVMSAIIALNALKVPCNVKLYSDSKYLVDAIEKNWLTSWQEKNWKTSSKKQVKNVDLWKQLIAAMKPHKIEWIWVKGHAGNEFNERCDELGVAAYNSDNLKIDEGYSCT